MHTESLRATCQRLLAAGTQQERLIESLLTLAQSQSGLAAQSPVDLGNAARNAVSSRTAQLAGAGLSIDSDLSPALISGDGQPIDQLIANLLDNAIRYNIPADFVSLRIGTEDDHCALTVANCGPHIAPEQVTRLQRRGPRGSWRCLAQVPHRQLPPRLGVEPVVYEFPTIAGALAAVRVSASGL